MTDNFNAVKFVYGFGSSMALILFLVIVLGILFSWKEISKKGKKRLFVWLSLFFITSITMLFYAIKL